jgi:small subunit ribosomal protein S15
MVTKKVTVKKTTIKTETKTKTTKVAPSSDGENTNAVWYQRHEQDTGSPEYQINLLTTKITILQEHLKVNHKDYDAKRSLLKMVANRRTFLRYLKSNSLDRYLMVSKKT